MRTTSKIISFAAILIIVSSIIFAFCSRANKQTIRSKVVDKERITQESGGNRESFYLIYTEAGPLKLEDDLFYGNFNSSDWYGQIHKDSTYTFETIGYRIGFISSYPNIVKFQK